MSFAYEDVQRPAHRPRHHPTFIVICVFANDVDTAWCTDDNLRREGTEGSIPKFAKLIKHNAEKKDNPQ
ncbi:MAG TPA: hypothetical protein VN763_10910 [Saprospiraceae bacterium]|nr:hypothetical protein [Saprospiraceae bacterium]